MAEPLTKGEQTRAEILSAARRLFLSQGFNGTSMRAIAQEAGGRAVAGLYNHFPTKEAIFKALIEEQNPYGELFAILEDELGRATTVPDYVRGRWQCCTCCRAITTSCSSPRSICASSKGAIWEPVAEQALPGRWGASPRADSARPQAHRPDRALAADGEPRARFISPTSSHRIPSSAPTPVSGSAGGRCASGRLAAPGGESPAGRTESP